jgi:hypothetical protein
MTDNRMFFGLLCRHEWDEVDSGTIKTLAGLDHTKPENWIETGIVIKLRCRHCGDVKIRKSRP